MSTRFAGAAALQDAIDGELLAGLLPFWRERAIDTARGGFLGEIAADGTPHPDAAKGLVLNARFLWTFSALYRELGDPRDLGLARRAYAYLESRFRDRMLGGYRWRVGPDGAPVDESKRTYGQAFCVYALAEYHLASDDASALEAARRTVDLIERHAREDATGGYLEACTRSWAPAAEQRLGDDDPVAPRSMNTHLHLLEAYTALYRACSDLRAEQRLGELLDIFSTRIFDAAAGPGGGHLRAFFDRDWSVLSDSYTYGHDIEAAWLLCEAADVLGDPARQGSTREMAERLARAALAEALDVDGALAYEGRAGSVIDGRREWWCQAEAVVGLWHAFTLTGEARFAEAAAGVWAFIAARMIDREHGEWHARVGADGVPDLSLPKVSEWKCPYHTVRMALEMRRRLGGATEARS